MRTYLSRRVVDREFDIRPDTSDCTERANAAALCKHRNILFRLWRK